MASPIRFRFARANVSILTKSTFRPRSAAKARQARIETLPPGRHLYKFIVDGQYWVEDEANPRTEPDSYGGTNSVFATAEHAFILKTWFPGTEATKRAESILASHGADADFKAALEAVTTANERAVLIGKANLLLQDKKKAEAIDAFKAVIAAHPDSKEAEAAKAALKKLGVKLEAPPKK